MATGIGLSVRRTGTVFAKEVFFLDHDQFACFPGRPFRMPGDKRLFAIQFWTLRTAAREWGVTYHTARRWLLLHPEAGVLVRVWSPRALAPRWRLCVFAGQPKADSGEGSALFRSSVWQRGMAKRRWWLQRHGRSPASDPVEIINKCLDSLPPAKPARSRQPIPGTNFPDQLPGQMSIGEYLKGAK